MRAMQESLLFRSGLLAAGNTDYEIAAELESGRIIRLTPGVYIPASRLSKLTSRDLHLAKVAARLEKCRNLILSHDSAAALWGLPMISGWSNAVHTYSGTQTNGGRRTPSRVWHRAAKPVQSLLVEGVPITSVAQTIADIARVKGELAALVQLDYALRLGLAILEDFAPFLEPGARGPGYRRLANAVAQADSRSESPGETISRYVMRRHHLPKPQLQFEIRDSRSNQVFRTDFGWPQFNLVGEFDGRVKYGRELAGSDEEARQVLWEEKRREDAIRRAGYQVVRWAWEDTKQPFAMVNFLLDAGLPGIRPTKSATLADKKFRAG